MHFSTHYHHPSSKHAHTITFCLLWLVCTELLLNPANLKVLGCSFSYFNSTHCCYHCFFSSSHTRHLLLLQTPCLTPIQQHPPYQTSINLSFYFQQKPSSVKQFPTFFKFYPTNFLFLLSLLLYFHYQHSVCQVK